jgi:hypothetical protein
MAKRKDRLKRSYTYAGKAAKGLVATMLVQLLY